MQRPFPTQAKDAARLTFVALDAPRAIFGTARI